jgi:hypothetical protein
MNEVVEPEEEEEEEIFCPIIISGGQTGMHNIPEAAVKVG